MRNTPILETIFWQHVRSPDRALDWYTGVLGLRDTGRRIGDGTPVLEVPGQGAMAVALTVTGLENPKTHGILDLRTSDIDEAHRVLTSRGENVTPIDNIFDNYYEFHVTDPEGHMIKIHSFADTGSLGGHRR
ncbi:VOC family protein [Paenibacillus flagellatus]|uniref:VOC domain-containing protein n=1 Tax=Paenibacillus flagellatus TaxID=2211139 RepID=A0A2V5KEJ3_9BACL|nr:VOC family protein [Paenibacillus flagellatus]PYI57542.1 hypothetical protein DLM86_03695 [Paenibacillus flagellatus]